YIEHAAALAFRGCRLGGQAIEAPEECGQGLAAACRRRHEDVAAGRDLLPATLLDLRGVREGAPKPVSRGGRKQVERVSHLISLSRSQRTNECSSTLALYRPLVIEPQRFREVMSSFPSGVVVLTAFGQDGLPRGLTVSAFCA